MRLTQVFQDTVHLMEGGHISQTRRPGERFAAPEPILSPKRTRRPLPLRLLTLLLQAFR